MAAATGCMAVPATTGCSAAGTPTSSTAAQARIDCSAARRGDLLHGGAGADRFVFVAVSNSPPDWLHDLIFDFSPAEGDRIDLRKLDGDPDRAGNQRLDFIGDDPFTEAGQVRAVIAGEQTLVEINLDHDRRAELVIDLAGLIQLHTSDFLV